MRERRSDIAPRGPTKPNGDPIARKYDPAFCKQILELAGQGMFPEEWCAELGVTMSTLYRWGNEYDEFDWAMKAAWHACAAYWSKRARSMATTDAPGSPMLLMRLLERRFPHVWSQRGKVTEEGYENRNAPPPGEEDGADEIPEDERALMEQLEALERREAALKDDD